MSAHRPVATVESPAADDQSPAKTNGSGDSALGNFWFNRHGKIGSYGLLVLAVILGFLIGLIAGNSSRDPPLAALPEPPSMSQCMTSTLALLDLKQPPTPEILRQVVEHCYSLIRSHGLLKDFATRELNFIQQYRANGVLMWMVVVVTLSGVLLAGLQLMASYQLAGSNKTSLGANNELSFKRDQVVLKSSITGLFILLLSFGFFLVFVFYVYRFEKLDDNSVRGPQQVPTLPMGGLGPPPPSTKNP